MANWCAKSGSFRLHNWKSFSFKFRFMSFFFPNHLWSPFFLYYYNTICIITILLRNLKFSCFFFAQTFNYQIHKSLFSVIVPDIAWTKAADNNHVESNMSFHPYFDFDMPRNITARVGQTAFLRCRVEQLGDKSVSHCKLCQKIIDSTLERIRSKWFIFAIAKWSSTLHIANGPCKSCRKV